MGGVKKHKIWWVKNVWNKNVWGSNKCWDKSWGSTFLGVPKWNGVHVGKRGIRNFVYNQLCFIVICAKLSLRRYNPDEDVFPYWSVLGP